MSNFQGNIDGHVVIPGTYTAAGGTTNFNLGCQPNHGRPSQLCEPFSTVPFAPDHDFVDRPEILAWVRNKCAGPGARAALVGLGGVGKSQLAIQHAHSVRDAEPHMFVFWVFASTKLRFEDAYRDIADRLELPGRDDPKINVLQLVCNWLRNETNGKWTMIVDNADDIDLFYPQQRRADDQSGSFIKTYADYLPQSRNGCILFTSRSKDAAARLAGGYPNIKEVSAFGEDQALQLLENKLHDTLSDNEGAVNLLRTLNYIPLAITQAAAYINQHAPQVTILSYIDEFNKSNESKQNLLNQDGGDLRRDRSASNSVVTTWQLTFDFIRKERRSAADLLSLMSFFNPQAIPDFTLRNFSTSAEARTRSAKDILSILQHVMGKEGSYAKANFNNDVAVLLAYSLISTTATKGVLKMHPLVQHCTISWLSSARRTGRWKIIFLELMEREFQAKNQGDWEECKQLVPHIDAFYSEESTGKLFKKWVQLTTDAGRLSLHKGKYNEAEKLSQRALEGCEKELGVQHPNTLLSVSNLACVLCNQGKYDEAEKLDRQALKGREKELGARHPDTLTSVNNLACVLRYQGKYDEAEKLSRQALNGREKELGVHHLATLTSVNNLACVLSYQRKYNEAEELNRRALEGREKELGVHHPDTLTSIGNLANVLQDQGKYNDAEKLSRQAVEGMEKELGVNHPDTLISVSNLANMLQDQGKYDEAEKLYQRALEGREEELGVHHPATLMSVNNLACVLRDQGKYDEAEKLNRRAVEGMEKEPGIHHPDTLASVSNLANVLRDQGKYDEAEKLYQRAIEGREKKLGVQHPATLTSIHGLARLLHKQKQYVEASELYQRACEGFKQKLGFQHPRFITCLDQFTAMQQEAQQEDNLRTK